MGEGEGGGGLGSAFGLSPHNLSFHECERLAKSLFRRARSGERLETPFRVFEPTEDSRAN